MIATTIHHPSPHLKIGRYYFWLGQLESGKTAWGRQYATHKIMLRTKLSHQGYRVKWICGHASALLESIYPTPKPQDITDLWRQLYALQHAGMTHRNALFQLLQYHKNGSCIALLHMLQHYHLSGHTMSEALRDHPQYFDHYTCILIAAGEAADCLNECIQKLITLHEHQYQLRQAVRKTASYPILILICTGLVMVCLLLWVIPSFEHTLASFNLPLQTSTRCIFLLSHLLRQYGLWTGIGITIIALLRPDTYLKHYLHPLITLLHRLPYISHLIRHYQLSIWFFMLGMLLTHHIPLTQALSQLMGNAPPNHDTLKIQKILQQVNHGCALSTALEQVGLLPGPLIALIYTGEHSQTLAKQCLLVSQRLHQQFSQDLQHATLFIEPLLMLLVGTLIGGITLALYLPIFHLGDFSSHVL